jgi:hypothetical protein
VQSIAPKRHQHLKIIKNQPLPIRRSWHGSG